jgi:hypothetical protein
VPTNQNRACIVGNTVPTAERDLSPSGSARQANRNADYMAISFKGLYLCLPKQPRPTHIRAEDGEQGQLTLMREDYEARSGQPPWQSLPWEGEEALSPHTEGKDIPNISM